MYGHHVSHIGFSELYQNITRRAHVYPPPELYESITLDHILDCWKDFCLSPKHHTLGIYIHIPFCFKKCSFCYCDTKISNNTSDFDDYLQALYSEMELYRDIFANRTVHSIYLGGGTPTHIGSERLKEVFCRIHQYFPSIASDCFVNVEGTPASITPAIAQVLGEFGTTRVTLGIQSLDERILQRMNRPQSFEEIATACSELRKNGISFINFDLIGGLTGDKEEDFVPRFSQLLELEPDMVHVYPYTPRPGLPASSDKKAILERSTHILSQLGYRSIKNDGWAKHDAASNWQVRHKIEDAGSCLGLGIRSRSQIFGRLLYRSSFFVDYQKSLLNDKIPKYEGFRLKKKHQIQAFLMNNLRTGFLSDHFEQLFLMRVQDAISKYAPKILPFLELQQHTKNIRVNQQITSDQQLNALIFDDVLYQKLFLHHIQQPKGWPKKSYEMVKKNDHPYDMNWMAFLSIYLTKGNTYPPITPNGVITEHQVQQAWMKFSKDSQKNKRVAGIYCHVPYCATRCKFCYCYSIQLQSKTAMFDYVEAVKRQIERLAPYTKNIVFSTLYFGGGTPSLLPPSLLDDLLTCIHKNFTFSDSFQFNFEGTPKTLGLDGRISILAKHKVSRLTIGIQSLEKHLLEDMDRSQPNRGTVGQVIQEAREHGIKTVNVDLLTGLPKQSFEDFQQSFEDVLSWRPEVMHVYPYQNTESTRYFQDGYRTTEAECSLRERMMLYATQRLQDVGYQSVPNESWCLGIEHRNQQDVDKIISASSVLPLGYIARGHIFGQMTYGTKQDAFLDFMKDHSKSEVYYGYVLQEEEDKVRYVISNLRSGFSRIDYQNLFGSDVVEDFCEQLTFLQQKQDAIQVTATEIVSKIRHSQHAVLYAKLFFSETYHQKLREQYAHKYDKNIDYIKELQAHYELQF